jgi:hypothetical protein
MTLLISGLYSLLLVLLFELFSGIAIALGMNIVRLDPALVE